MNRVTAIVVAAGKGLRLKKKTSKPLVAINSKPIIFYCLNTLSHHPAVKEIIVVANKENLKNIARKISRYRIKKIKQIVLGGLRRQNSVENGLKAIDAQTDLVLIHDGARPFINQRMISAAIKEAKKNGAAIVGVPVKATVKKVKNLAVEKTIDRDGLWEVQTPQVFKRDLILKAYKKFGDTDATDDALLVEKLGVKVSVVAGSYTNIKITTPEDLAIAKEIARCNTALA